MQLITSLIRPHKAEAVQQALTQAGVSGMTIMEVRGRGKHGGRVTTYRGRRYELSLLPTILIECVVPEDVVDDAVRAVLQAARTGEVGDGHVFVTPVGQSYRIRTGQPEERR